MATRAENAAVACELRARGWLLREISAHMGLSHSYTQALVTDPEGHRDKARKDSYRRPCPECGTLMSGHDGPGSPKAPRLCSPCAHLKEHAERKWTRETMIAAVHLWVEENGRPPLATEWLHNRDPRFPPVSLTSRNGRNRSQFPAEFNSWADFIEAAGYPRPLVGHKVNARGKGAHQVARAYIVLERNNRGGWREHRVDAYSPETAVEQVATHAGTYAVVLAQYFNEVNVAPVRRFAIVANGTEPESEEAPS